MSYSTSDQILHRSTVIDLHVWRDRRSWLAAAEHLNAKGLPACVPCELVAWLRRHGISAWCQERAA